MSHQLRLLSGLRNQVRELTAERDKLKELGLTAEDKQKMEAQLAEVKLDNSKLSADLLTATNDMQQLKLRAETAEGEVTSLRDRLKEEQIKSKKLEVSLKACEEEVDEYRQAVPQLEEDKLLAFESGLLVARDHADRSKVWDQIDWTTIRIPSNNDATLPPYFRKPGKISKLSREYDKQCETSKRKEQ